jgi:hypothetical protein
LILGALQIFKEEGRAQILNVGVISKPTAADRIWYPAKFSKKLKPISGQVIIFAKKPTWCQKYVAP